MRNTMLNRNHSLLAAAHAAAALILLASRLEPSAMAAPPAPDPMIAKLRSMGVELGPVQGGGMRFSTRNPTPEACDLLAARKDVKVFSGGGTNEQALLNVCRVKTLETIEFDGLSGTQASLVALSSLPNLRKLVFVHTVLKDGDFSVLKNCTQLERVAFAGAFGFSEKSMKSFAELTQVKHFGFYHTDVTSEGFAHVAKLKNLETLGFHTNWEPWIIGSDFVHLAPLRNLRELRISRMVLPYKDGLSHLKSLPQLKVLHFDSCAITDEDFEKLKQDLPNTTITRTIALEEKAKAWNAVIERRKKEAEAKAAAEARSKQKPKTKPKPKKKSATGAAPSR